MIKLKQIENRKIKFPEFGNIAFDVYDISGYDFKENLSLPSDESNLGVYIFTHRHQLCSNIGLSKDADKIEKQYVYIHDLLYCGKTSTLDKRFYNHTHQDDLKGKVNCICIHLCENKEEISDIEKLLLETHNFKFNTVLNQWSVKEEEVPEVL